MGEEKVCPFCGAKQVFPETCPTCHHTTDYVFGDKFACGTVNQEDDDGLEWFRHKTCYEAQLAAAAAREAEMREVLMKVAWRSKIHLSDCDCAECEAVDSLLTSAPATKSDCPWCGGFGYIVREEGDGAEELCPCQFEPAPAPTTAPEGWVGVRREDLEEAIFYLEKKLGFNASQGFVGRLEAALEGASK